VFPSSVEDAVIKVTSDAAGFSGPVTVTKVHTYLSYVLGDVNLDGYVTTIDAVKILQYYVGSLSLTDTQLKAADVNHDSDVSTLDAVKILQYYVGSISEF
jgi:pectate lyase